MSKPEYGPAVERWEKASEWPLAIFALIFIAAYAWPILYQGIPPGWNEACHVMNWIVWGVFVFDFAARLVLTRYRWSYTWRHGVDVAVIVLPILRPLRLLRLIMLLRMLNRSATNSLRGRIAIYVGGATLMLIFFASLAVLDAEQHADGSNITNFGTALWWSVVTITTVGYGDHYPITVEGRFVAIGLMVGGIALIGVVTASVASWLIDRVRAEEEASHAATRADVAELGSQLSELRALVLRLHDVDDTKPIHNRV